MKLYLICCCNDSDFINEVVAARNEDIAITWGEVLASKMDGITSSKWEVFSATLIKDVPVAGRLEETTAPVLLGPEEKVDSPQ
jgi:hypothetical protein